MSKRVTNQDLLLRVERLETTMSLILTGIKWLTGLTAMVLSGIIVQFVRSIVTH